MKLHELHHGEVKRFQNEGFSSHPHLAFTSLCLRKVSRASYGDFVQDPLHPAHGRGIALTSSTHSVFRVSPVVAPTRVLPLRWGSPSTPALLTLRFFSPLPAPQSGAEACLWVLPACLNVCPLRLLSKNSFAFLCRATPGVIYGVICELYTITTRITERARAQSSSASLQRPLYLSLCFTLLHTRDGGQPQSPLLVQCALKGMRSGGQELSKY